MSSTQADSLSTGISHNGDEVAVRARSQHSRDAHVPATDDHGDLVFVDEDGDPVPERHPDARPKPACGVKPNTETEWVLRPVRSVSNRGPCRRCFAPDDVADQNAANGGSKTFARVARFGDEWGDEDSSANQSHTSTD